MIKHHHMLKEILPADTIFVRTSSLYPSDIINLVKKIEKQHQHQPVALDNIDIWRYGQDPDLMHFLNNDIRDFYIITLGYENKRIARNIIELSWPYYYFCRQKNDGPIDSEKNREYAFSCLNNNSSFERLILGYNLWTNNLLEQMIFSQNLTELPGGNYVNILNNLPGMEKYIHSLPRKWHIENSSNFHEDWHKIDHVAYHDSYCNIVTESQMQEFIFEGPVIDLPIITEKSYKPFRAMQIPIWFAAPGHIRYLQSLGFETMQDLLPDNFDQLGVFDRSQAVCDIVKKGHEYIQDFYFSHTRELKHNYDLIWSDKVDNLIIDNVKSFLSDT